MTRTPAKTARLRVGARELMGGLAAYAKRFNLLEVRGLDAENLRLGPTPATLKRWRRGAPPTFEFAVVAGPNLAKLRPSAAFDAELETFLSTATLLESKVLVVPTPADVTPAKLARDRLARLFDRLPRDVNTLVWEPSGLWELDDAAAAARNWGVVVAVDPSRDAPPAGPVAYGRLRALGATRAFSSAALARVADRLRPHRDAYVVIETESALKEAKMLRQLVRTAPKPVPTLHRLRPATMLGEDEEE